MYSHYQETEQELLLRVEVVARILELPDQDRPECVVERIWQESKADLERIK